MRRRHAAVAVARDEPIEQEAGAHRQLAARQRSIERQGEGQRTDRVRRDPRERPPLADRLARAAEVERLQIAQAAVNRPQVVERAPLPKSSRSMSATDRPRCAASYAIVRP